MYIEVMVQYVYVYTFKIVTSSWWAELLVLKCPLNLQSHSLP